MLVEQMVHQVGHFCLNLKLHMSPVIAKVLKCTHDEQFCAQLEMIVHAAPLCGHDPPSETFQNSSTVVRGILKWPLKLECLLRESYKCNDGTPDTRTSCSSCNSCNPQSCIQTCLETSLCVVWLVHHPRQYRQDLQMQVTRLFQSVAVAWRWMHQNAFQSAGQLCQWMILMNCWRRRRSYHPFSQ